MGTALTVGFRILRCLKRLSKSAITNPAPPGSLQPGPTTPTTYVPDEDGVVVVPRALADEVAEDSQEQERFEGFVRQRVDQRDPVTGLYPPNQATLAAYRRWLDDGEPGGS